MGIGFSETEENGGGQGHNRTQPGTNDENLENAESGGGEITTIEELEGLVGDECMELREEQVQMIKKMKKKRKTSFSCVVPFWGNHCGPMSTEMEEKSRCESTYRNCHTENRRNQQDRRTLQNNWRIY